MPNKPISPPPPPPPPTPATAHPNSPTSARLRWPLGLLALCLTLLIGGTGALWSLQQLRTNTERDARQDAQAMADSVAQTLALQISRAVRLGIPLEEIPGMPDYLQRALTQAPGLATIAVQSPAGQTLYLSGASHSGAAHAATAPVQAAIQVQGSSVGDVVITITPATLAQGLNRAYALCALLVLALALLAGWLAARGPGQQLESQRQQLQAALDRAPDSGASPDSPLLADTALPALHHGGMARALHALAAGQLQRQEQEAAVRSYAQELLAVDFDQLLQAPVARIVASTPAPPAPPPQPPQPPLPQPPSSGA